MESLLPYFRTYGLMVIHAPASTLGPAAHHGHGAAGGHGQRRSGVMTGHKSLKQALHGPACMVAALLQHNTAAERRKAQSQLMTLRLRQTPSGRPHPHHHHCHAEPQDLQRLPCNCWKMQAP